MHRKVPQSFDLEDFEQIAVFKAWQKYQTWDPAKNDKFQGYAILAVRGQVLMSVRRQNWFEHSDMIGETHLEAEDGFQSLLEQLAPTEETPESELLEGESTDSLEEGIAALAPELHEIVHLVFFEGFTIHKAIRMVGCSKREGEERYERAIAALKEAMAAPADRQAPRRASRFQSDAAHPVRPPLAPISSKPPVVEGVQYLREPVAPTSDSPPSTSVVPTTLSVALIHENPEHLRTEFDPAAIEGLAQSIRIHGILQPLIVRTNGERYELVAGKRRLLAATLAGLDTVPVIVQDLVQALALEVALVENVQRVDLNPMDLAIAYGRLHSDLGLSYEEIARRTGKDRASIMNVVRLLRLAEPVRNLVSENRLGLGHARALLNVSDEAGQVVFAKRAAAQGLSVRQVETLINQEVEAPDVAVNHTLDRNPTAGAAAKLDRVLGARVRILERDSQAGHIEIEYRSPADLVRIVRIVTGSPFSLVDLANCSSFQALADVNSASV